MFGPLIRVTVDDRGGYGGANPGNEPRSQMLDPSSVLGLTGDRYVDGRRERSDSCHAHCARAQVPFLATSVQQRCRLQIAANEQSSDPHRATELVPTYRHGVELARTEVKRQESGSLHGIAVYGNVVLASNPDDVSNRLHRPHLIVSPHRRDGSHTRRVSLNTLAEVVENDSALFVDRRRVDARTFVFGEPRHRIEQRVMFDRTEDNAVARWVSAGPKEPLDGEVVRFGPTRKKNYFARPSAEALGDQFAGFLDGPSCRAARGMECGCIPSLGEHFGHHRDRFWHHRRSGRMVEVDSLGRTFHRPTSVVAGQNQQAPRSPGLHGAPSKESDLAPRWVFAPIAHRSPEAPWLKQEYAAVMSNSAKEFGRKADNSTLLDTAVRVGLVSYGLVHLLIGWIAAKLAFGNGGDSPSKDGALKQIAQQPLGTLILYVMAAGFASLVVWQLIEMFAGHRDENGGVRKFQQAASGLKVCIYGFFGYSSLTMASGDSGSGDKSESLTAKVLSLPAGQILVAVIGASVVGYACSLIYHGLSEGFREHLKVQGQKGDLGSTYVALGKVGYIGKGIALLGVGGLFLWAAVTHDANKSGGLGQALKKLLEQPFGPVMLGAIAFGLISYGLFSFARARHMDR